MAREYTGDMVKQAKKTSKNATGANGSLNAEAYLRIRADIITGDLKPGEYVSEGHLSERYGLGKAAIRNALARIIQDGLVVNRGRQGHQVKPITLRDIREVFQIRRLLEPAAARAAAENPLRGRLEELQKAAEADYAPDDREGQLQFLHSNSAFHALLAEVAGNHLLAEYISHLQDVVIRILYLGIRVGDQSTPWRHRHTDICAAVLDGDADKAEQLMREHLDRSEKMVMKTVMEVPDLWDVNLGSFGCEN